MKLSAVNLDTQSYISENILFTDTLPVIRINDHNCDYEAFQKP